MCTLTAAGPTTWATRSATAPKASSCWHGGARNSTPCTRAAPRTRFSWRSWGPCGSTPFRAQPFADLIQAFVQDQTVARYRDWEELFGYCRYSANPVGRLVLYLCGYSDAAAAAALRRHLHGPATGQLLAGRDRGPVEGPRLHPARGHGAPRLHGRRVVRAPLHAGLPRDDARDRGKSARAVRGGAAAHRHGGPAPGARSGSVQPRRHARARQDRTAGLRRAGRAARHFEGGARAACCWVRWRAWPSRGRPHERGRAILRVLPARGPNPRQELLLLLPAAHGATAQSHVRHLCLHALLRRSERRARRHARGH